MKNSRIMKLIISGLLIVLGALALIWPAYLYDLISYVLGGGLIAYGLALVIEYFKTPKELGDRYYALAGGAVFILSGIALILIPIAIIETIIGLIVAIGLLLISFALIARSLIERPRFDGWVIRFLIGVITFFASMIVFSNLNAGSDALARIIGGVAVYIGINNILGMVLIKPKSQDDPDKVDIDFTK